MLLIPTHTSQVRRSPHRHIKLDTGDCSKSARDCRVRLSRGAHVSELHESIREQVGEAKNRSPACRTHRRPKGVRRVRLLWPSWGSRGAVTLALVLEEFGHVITQGGAGVVIASQSGHRLPPLAVEQNTALATTPVEELLSLPFLQLSEIRDSLHAYQLSKRGNSLRVMAEAVRWGRRGARINTISPGIIMTPLARDELTGPRGEGYRRMIEVSAAGRPGTPDEVATVAALLMGSDGGFITGSDFLMDGGVTAAYWYGELAAR
jgi:NAD(P)-dependent dehydrogenase (short-subunit alcohol dehydrogenase family)